MPRFSVRVDGLSEAKAALASLPTAFRDVVSEDLQVGGMIILSEMLGRAPVDEGELIESAGMNTRDDGLQVAVGYGDFKARFVEFGTEDTPAQPSLFPGFRAGARYVRRQMRGWTLTAGRRVRNRTKRGKRANTGWRGQ